MKIVVLGKSGQLGSQLLADLKSGPQEVLSFDENQIDFLNITEESLKPIKKFNPDFILNAAAYTQVDKAEENKELALKINGECKSIWSKLCNNLQCHFVDISTDFVFSGEKNSPYLETDATGPLSVYGKSKLLGENILREECQFHTIIRTSWLYSKDKPCFLTTMQRLGRERDSLGVVADQIGTPTAAPRLSEAILHYISRCDKKSQGLYHFSNEGVASWYDFAKAIFDLSEINVELKPIETHQYPTPATRPKYSVLNKSLFSEKFEYEIPHWQDDLALVIGRGAK